MTRRNRGRWRRGERPLGLLLTFFFLSLVLAILVLTFQSRLDQVPGVLRPILAILSLLLGPLVFLTCAEILLVKHDPLRPADVIVVMGTPTKRDGRPSRVMRCRVKEGVALHRARYAATLLLTGGAAYNDFSEAEAMAKLATAFGAPREAIVVEGRSHSTAQNIRFAARFMWQRGWRLALVVTCYYNTRRVATLLGREGIEVVAVPAPNTWRPLTIAAGIFELLAWVAYLALGTREWPWQRRDDPRPRSP